MSSELSRCYLAVFFFDICTMLFIHNCLILISFFPHLLSLFLSLPPLSSPLDILPLSVTVVEASGMDSLTQQLSSMTTEEECVSNLDMATLTQRLHGNCLVNSEQTQASSELGVDRDSVADRCQQEQSMDNDECVLHQRTSSAPHSPFS